MSGTDSADQPSVSGIISSFSAQHTIGAKAVGIQVALMTIITLVTLVAFEVLRPANKLVYQPKTKYYVGNKKPPPLSVGPLSWIPPLIRTKEPELLDKVGLDAVTYLRFLRMLRYSFSLIALLTCGVLLPINLIYNLHHKDDSNNNNKNDTPDILTMLTIENVQGNLLYAHVAVSWAINFIVMFFLWTNWRRMIQLRNQWFRSPEYQQSFYARTVMIEDVPRKAQSDAGLQNLMSNLQIPYPTTAVHIGRRVGDLPRLIEYYNDTVRQLEQVLVRYLKNGTVGKKRPLLSRGGFLGIGGQKVDAIDFYCEKLKRVESAIARARDSMDTKKAESYGFASMGAVPYAHIVASMLRGKRRQGAVVGLAPNPKDIIWTNLSASPGTIARKKTMGWIYLVLFCAFNTVPLLAISLLANLQSIAVWVPFLENWKQSSADSFSLVSGVLPSAVMALFAVLFPIVLRKLSKYQGAVTRSSLDRAVVARYFAFLTISQLVIFTLISVVYTSVSIIVGQIGRHASFVTILKNLHTLPGKINSTYIGQSSYWLTWFPLRGFLSVFDLAQIVHLVWVLIKTRLFGRTPRDVREWTQPPDFDYSTYYANLLFMCAVALVFAPLAPLVAAIAAIVFWINSLVYKYQIMFVFTTKVESGGRIWNVVTNRLLVCCVFMQLLMVLTTGLQFGFRTFRWLTAVPPIVILFFFKVYISRTFRRSFQYYTPSNSELANVRVHSERADVKGHRLEKRFGHPALHADLFTPMVHANMTHLLAEVFRGRLGTSESNVSEFGGAVMETKVIQGGIRIAAVEQNDLEYDPALYQRDRGEADWDARSMSSSTVFTDAASVYLKDEYKSPPLGSAAYNDYLARGPGARAGTPSGGPGARENYEMSRMSTREEDQAPLLHSQHLPYGQSSTTLNRTESGWSTNSPGTGYPAQQMHNNYPPNYSYEGFPNPPVNNARMSNIQLSTPQQSRQSTYGDGQAYREAPTRRYHEDQGGYR